MTRTVEQSALPPVGIALLLRTKLREVSNRIKQVSSDAPLKVALTGAFLLLIWYGLYLLFALVFEYFQQSLMESIVTIPLMFHVFFIALMVMLAFSNGILVYGSLFRRDESAFLMASPLIPSHVVLLKYLESILFSSWSLLLLGVPLMMAMARTFNEPWYFYPLFFAFFLSFVPIPAAMGLAGAAATARWFPRNPRRLLLVLATVLVVVVSLWAWNLTRTVHPDTADWLDRFFVRVKFLQSALLPSAWVSNGIEEALQDRPGVALGYLLVTLSNGLLLSIVVVKLSSRRFILAFDRAHSGSGLPARSVGALARALERVMFWYLPGPLRLIAGKDLRTFLRDPMQWSQLAILFGLLTLYLANLPRLYPTIGSERWKFLMSFLNLSAVGFMLATFTTRFVFPLISLEGRQLWIVGLLPVPRRNILLAKFAFAMTITLAVSLGVTLLAMYMLQMSWSWTLVHMLVAVSLCTGLCGAAVGFGAILPDFEQSNPSRIANGFGGTINLLLSMVLVVLVLGGMAYVGLRSNQFLGDPDWPGFDNVSLLVISAVIGVGLLAAAISMAVGGRTFDRAEI